MARKKTIAYYERLNSRLGYQLLLGGHRHFGWYRGASHLSMTQAAEAMIDHLADFADITNGSRVLDAGCGEGKASIQLAQKYGAKVCGVDIVPRSIAIAKNSSKDNGLVDFQIADYNKLPFGDNTFDVVFTLETFTHSANPKKTLEEFLRVLKPGGRIAIFDYSIAAFNEMPPETAEAIRVIARETDCPGFATITHDYYEKLLPKLHVSDFLVVDESEAVKPAIKLAYQLAWMPYHILRLLGRQNHHPNILIGYTAWKAMPKDYIRYITVKISK